MRVPIGEYPLMHPFWNMSRQVRKRPSSAVAFVTLFGVTQHAAHRVQRVEDLSPILVSTDDDSEKTHSSNFYDIDAHVEKLKKKIVAAEEVIARCLERLETDDVRIRQKLERWERRARHLQHKQSRLQQQAQHSGS